MMMSKMIAVASLLALLSVQALAFGQGDAMRFDQRRILSNPSTTANETADLFESFVKKNDKTYADEAEREYRFGTFLENMQRAQHLSESFGDDVTHGLNSKFFDMSHDEFTKRVLMTKQSASTGSPKNGSALLLNSNTTAAEDLPSSFDWRDHGAVTSVKDQGTVGTCWAFAAVGNIEGQVAIQQNKLVDLSVEQIADCDGGTCGIFGGGPSLAYQYVINAGGLQTWEDYPYCMLDDQCTPCLAPGYSLDFCGAQPRHCKMEDSCHFDSSKAAVTLTDWASLSSDEDELAAQLAQNGPVSVIIDAELLTTYSEGIVTSNYCSSDPADGNHAVLLVGFGSTTSEDGSMGVPYWIVKNSWGKDWGEDGYFRLLRGANTCGVANTPTTSIL